MISILFVLESQDTFAPNTSLMNRKGTRVHPFIACAGTSIVLEVLLTKEELLMTHEEHKLGSLE
jgi:hypothetical protein